MSVFRNARDCLGALAERYSAIRSYSDVGFVRPVGTSLPPSCWFETHYASPARFRFEFVTAHPFRPLRHITTKSIIGSNGESAYYYTHFPRSEPRLEYSESLARVVGRATGVSQGTAHTIGKLLIPTVSGFALTDLRRPRFRRSREFDGVACLCISGIHPRRGRLTLWLGARDLLLRKLIHHKFRHEEVRQRIAVDQPIHEQVFAAPKIGT